MMHASTVDTHYCVIFLDASVIEAKLLSFFKNLKKKMFTLFAG